MRRAFGVPGSLCATGQGRRGNVRGHQGACGNKPSTFGCQIDEHAHRLTFAPAVASSLYCARSILGPSEWLASFLREAITTTVAALGTSASQSQYLDSPRDVLHRFSLLSLRSMLIITEGAASLCTTCLGVCAGHTQRGNGDTAAAEEFGQTRQACAGSRSIGIGASDS